MKKMMGLIITLIFINVSGYAFAREKCGIENCHGLEMTCGPNVPDACAMMYMFGDFCRQYAHCEVIEGKCRLVEDENFSSCRSCLRECEDKAGENVLEVFNCENQCRQSMEGVNGESQE